jgi:hypothetical protein
MKLLAARTTIKALFVMVLKYCAAVIFLHFVGSLSWMASTAISILLPLDRPKTGSDVAPNFSPYQIMIEPRIGLMLGELGLITDEKWKSLNAEAIPYRPWTALCLAAYGSRGVVLSVDKNGDNIVHWTDTNHYTNSPQMSVRLDFLTFPDTYFAWSPDFFFRNGSGGYHIGIEVRENWWKEHEQRLQQSGIVKSVDTDYRFGTTRLTFEILPYEVFWPFYRKVNKSLSESVKRTAKDAGWEYDEMGGPEIGYFGDGYKGKYSTIWLKYLSDGT